MDKKHYMTLVVIGLVTLIFAIIAASYAYFAASFETDDSVGLGAKTAAQTAAFITSSSGQINIDVSADLMQEGNSNNDETADELTDSGTLTLYLTTAEDKKVSSCTFNIIFEWNPESTEYIRTPNVEKEFTLEGKVIDIQNVPTLSVDDPNERLFKMNTPDVKEINFDELTWHTKTITEGIGEEQITKEVRYANIIEGGIISSLTKDAPTVVTYEFTMRFYNASRDQSIQRNKNFAGEIKVDSSSVNC